MSQKFKKTFGLTVLHRAFSFQVMAIHGERGEIAKGTGELDVHVVPLPEVPAIKGLEQYERGPETAPRAETKAARERAVFGHFFKDSWKAYRAGDRDTAEREFKIEWAAVMGGEIPWPGLDLDELLRRRRAALKRRHDAFRRRYVLTALWDGVISHMDPAERTEFMRPHSGQIDELARAIHRDIEDLALPRTPGRFSLTLRKCK